MISEDKNGDGVRGDVKWKKGVGKKGNEDEERGFESLYERNGVRGEKVMEWGEVKYK